MISRVRWVSVAILAMLAVASACPAAEVSPGPGRGGIGGQIGASSFTPDHILGKEYFGDYSAGAQSRFAFGAHWRYIMTPSLRWQISPGFLWAGYSADEPARFTDPNFPNDPDKSEYLTLMLPISAQLQFLVRRGPWIYYIGGGPGVYRVWVENHRKVLEDPLTHKLHRGVYPGASVQIGFERFLKSLPSVSLELAGVGHVALSRRDEQFPSGYNSNVGAIEVRMGGNYYFTPGVRKKPADALPTLPNP